MVTISFNIQYHSQSPQALWPAVGRQERLWGAGILLPQDFCGKTMQAVTEQPIKNFKVFRFDQSPFGGKVLDKEHEDSGYAIDAPTRRDS